MPIGYSVVGGGTGWRGRGYESFSASTVFALVRSANDWAIPPLHTIRLPGLQRIEVLVGLGGYS